MKRKRNTIDHWFASDVGEELPTLADARQINEDCTQRFYSFGKWKNTDSDRTIKQFLSDDYRGWY